MRTIFLQAAFIFLVVASLNAQTELPTGQVEIIKNFDARLLDTERKAVMPKLPMLDTATKRQNYTIVARPLTVEYLPPRIQPLAMSQDDLQKKYNGYLKTGAGFPNSFFLDGSYSFISQEKLRIGLDAFHHSANNNSQVENQRFGLTDVGLGGVYYDDLGFAVDGRLGYTVDKVHYYGYNDFTRADSTPFSFDAEDVKQRFSTFSGRLSIFNGERTQADFNYFAGAEFYLLQDLFSARERGFNLKIGGTKWFADAHPLTVTLETDFTTLKTTEKQNLNNFFLRPSYTYHGDIFKAKIGGVVASHEDEFSFFPDIELGANILNNIVGVFVGAEGGLQKNHFKALSDYNPFINSRLDIKNTNFNHFYGGAKGNYAGFDYRVQLGYKNADNLALFLPNGDSIPKFNVLYDTVNIFTVQGTVSAPVFKGFEILGSLTQNIYSLNTQDKAWGLPSLTLNVGAKYKTLEDKLLVKGELYIQNGVPYLEKATSKNLSPLFDISLGAEYNFTENIGAFFHLNNLAANKRERWRHYPVYGLNLLAGITARF